MNKNKYSYVGISLVILVFGIIFVPKIIDRITNSDIIRNESRSENLNEPKGHLSDLAFIGTEDGNRKVPPFSFTDQDGLTVTNKDYEGKVYVVEFFFTTCPTICPRMSANLIQIQNSLTAYKDFGVASFTINPDHDTPEILKKYAEHYGVSNPNWHLLTGSQEDIYKLANEGFYIYTAQNEEIEGGFEHSGNFALIDKNGFIRSRITDSGNPLIYYNGTISEEEGIDDEGYKEEISLLKEDIKKLLNE